MSILINKSLKQNKNKQDGVFKVESKNKRVRKFDEAKTW